MIVIKGTHDFKVIDGGGDMVVVRFTDSEQDEYSMDITKDVADILLDGLLDYKE